MQALSSASPCSFFWTTSTAKISRVRRGWKASAYMHNQQCFTILKTLLAQTGHECTLLSIWGKVSLLFIHSFTQAERVRPSCLAATKLCVSGIFLCTKQGFSSSSKRMRKAGWRGSWIALVCISKCLLGIPLPKRWRADAFVSSYQYTCIYNLFLNHLFDINKGVCLYDHQSLMIFPAALVLSASNPLGSKFLQMIKISSFTKCWETR